MSAYQNYTKAKRKAIKLLKEALDAAHSTYVERSRWDAEEGEGDADFDEDAYEFVEDHIQEALAELEEA